MASAAVAELGSERILDFARQVMRLEIRALEQSVERLDGSFVQAVEQIAKCEGQVVLTGIGKSFFIAQKISASLASIGVASVAVHPVDGLHGDLGRLKYDDIILALSNSGSSPEVVNFVRAAKTLGVQAIALTCRKESLLARSCTFVVDLGVIQEACSMGLVPSSSTTAMLAVGDALALSLAQLRGFTPEGFARFHPAGHLGLRLQPVEVAMRALERTAFVQAHESILFTLQEISRKRCGAAFVVNADCMLLGIFTDGDLRRLLARGHQHLDESVERYMVPAPKRVKKGLLVESAIEILREHRIDELPVVDDRDILLGHLDIQDLA
jgi:arabinose-5-phosphate isomerase